MFKMIQPFQVQTVYMGSIDYGHDILTTLETFCREHDIQTAWLNLMGALSEVTLAYYEQEGHQYVQKHFTGEFEILNGTGNISLKDNSPMAHVHLTLSNTSFGCIGGHLVKGTSKVFACEFALFVLEGETLLQRKPDDKTGLALWAD